MMNSKNVFLAKLCFVLAFTGALIYFSSLKPRIMVIHTCSEKDTWGKEFNAGFHRFFSKANYATVFYQYLNARSNSSEIYKLKTGVLARQTIDRLNPDLFVLCERDAQELIGRNYVNVPGKNIIFCGLNGSSQDYGYDEARNVTGVFERLPLEAFKEVIPLLVSGKNPPDKIKIIVLGDNSDVSKVLKQTFAATNWAPYNLIDLITVSTFEDWKNTVSSLTHKADILIIANYRKIYTDDTQTALKNPEELMDWTRKNTPVPMIGSIDSFVRDGGEIALTTSPLGQGETTAKLAHRIMSGENARDIAPINVPDFLVHLNNEIKNSKLYKLPSIYHAFACAMGKCSKKE